MNTTASQPKTASFATANLRDLAAAFTQQMFFWGMDAALSTGNLFVKNGFTKSPSTGLRGTSCYSLPREKGHIFLHGACVGWIPNEGSAGFIFIRPKGKCFRWMDDKPPVPGKWPSEKMAAPSLPDDLPAITTFLSWWLGHEAWISAEMGSVYRENCHRKYKSLPKSKPWLVPSDAAAWLTLLMVNPANTPRAKRFSRLQAA